MTFKNFCVIIGPVKGGKGMKNKIFLIVFAMFVFFVTGKVSATDIYVTENQTYSVIINYADKSTNKTLAGATLALKDANGNTIHKWTTSGKLYRISGLKAGNYMITTVSAPNGYKVNKNLHFVVSPGQSEKTIVVSAEKSEQTATTYSVIINYADKNTNKTLAGATLALKDANGNTIHTWRTTENLYRIKGLKAGNYVISTTSAANGYKVNKDLHFVISEGQSEKTIVVGAEQSEQIATYSIVVNYVDKSTNKTLAGATLALKDANGNTIYTWKTTENLYRIKGLKAGNYVISTTSAASGYEKNKDLHFVISAGQSEKTIVVSAEKTKQTATTYSVVINYKDKSTNKTLAGATLAIRDANGNILHTWDTTTQLYRVKGLKAGKYSIVVLTAASGYQTNDDLNFTISEGQAEQTINVVATKTSQSSSSEKVGTIKVYNIDATTKKALAGTTIELRDENGKVVEKWVSGKSAHVIIGLKPGKYTVVVVGVSKGYGLNDGVIPVDIIEECDTISEVTISHSAIPNTGDLSIMLIYAGFALTLGIGAFGMYKLSHQS